MAVALVVFSHAKVPGFSGGFVGVDIFFVLSGYLITGLLVDEHSNSGTIAYGRFLARRLRRLLPAMLLMIVLVASIATATLTDYEMRMQGNSHFFASTWVSNFYFAFAERDYFSALQAKDLFLHTWSLGVEEQFYLVWPWLMLAFLGIKTRDQAAASQTNVVLWALTMVFLASLTLSLYLSQTIPILSFYMMPARGWQFALGAAVFVSLRATTPHGLNRSGGGHRSLAMSSVAAIGLAAILGSALFLGPEMNYPGYFALFPSFGAAMIIAAGGLSARHAFTGTLSSKPFVWFGDRSYSIYLWHWPALILGESFGLTRSSYGIVVVLAISLGIAMASYRFVELPFWKGRLGMVTPARTLLYSGLAIIISVSIGLLLTRTITPSGRVLDSSSDYYPRYDTQPAIHGFGLICDTGIDSSDVTPCPVGDHSSEKVLVLWGDSVGAQWTSLIASVYAAPDWQVIVLTKSACAIVDVSYFYKGVDGDYKVCTEWRKNALNYIAELQPDIVVVGSSSAYDFSEVDWVEGSSRILTELASATEQVLVIPGIPSLSFDGPICLENPRRMSFGLVDSRRECEEAQFGDQADNVSRYLELAAKNIPTVKIVDLNHLVCPDRRCAARNDDGVIVFRDTTHLTKTFVDTLVPYVRQKLADIGAVPIPD